MSAVKTGWSLYFILPLLSVYTVLSFNVEELKWVNYEVDISRTPVKREEVTHPVVYITSKNGQEFQCMLPQLNEEEISEKEVAHGKEEDVIDLLKPMKSGSCLSKGKDWWTYEFCFGHYIKQFHVEDGQIIGQVITLGLYESDYDWNNETDQEKFKHAKQKYHSQYYTNGTKCDLTGQPRNAEVRIYCEEGAGDYIYRVDEPGTCSYIITVHTSRLCSHPQLKPLPSNKAHSIPCHPLLNEEQYSNYLQKLKDYTESTTSEGSEASNSKSGVKYEEMVQNFFLQEIKMVKDKELEKLKTSLPPEKFASVKNDIQKQFDTILSEAEEDLYYSKSSEETKGVTLSKLTSVLSMLLEKLDKAEKDVVQATKELNKARSVISDGHPSDSKDNLQNDDAKDVKDSKENELYEETLKAINSDQSRPAVLDDDKLQVRIRRLDRKSTDTSGKLHEMDFEQRKQLEQAVKEKLEKAGLDTGGRRIEVKIITAGYYDNEDGKDFQSLTDEETDQFKNMIMALLTGQQEAVQEMKRHKKLEESYKFTWDENEEMDNRED